MPAVPVTEPQKVIPKTNVYDIILPQRSEIVFSLDVKPFDLIEKIALQQGVEIQLHRMNARAVPARFLL